jgi:hypothetical protein
MSLTQSPWVVGVARTLQASSYDASGNLSNALEVTVTVTDPTGAVTTPTPTNPSLGRYVVEITPTLVGTYSVVWAMDGADSDSSFGPDSFDVVDAGLPPAVGLIEVKEHLNIPDANHNDDGELLRFMLAATRAIEQRVGPLTRRSVTESHNGGRHAIVLRHSPVIEVTSASENGEAVPSGGYTISPASGVLTRTSGYSRATWVDGFNNVTVAYVAGRTSIPADLRQAVLELVRHLWSTQRGSMAGRRTGEEFVSGQGYTLPNRVLELIGPYEMPGMA